jgi:NAD-dependent SIR2 family protein deacetylase
VIRFPRGGALLDRGFVTRVSAPDHHATPVVKWRSSTGLAERIGSLSKPLFETGLNLSALEAVIVAADYPVALRKVQKTSGFAGPSEGANEDDAMGVAMAVPVMREGGPRSVMVLHAGAMSHLDGDDVATFLRLFEIRAPQPMWLVGAGASCAAGIPSAGDMIWEFKSKLFCSEQCVPASAVVDIGDAAVRSRIQAHLDGRQEYPARDSEEEYSRYFEATYPSPKDRRAYIEAKVASARPSFGHHVMALLMKEGLLPAAWTPNFDTLIEDAAASAFGGVGRLLVADLAEPGKAARGVDQSRWPLLGKLHGDFQSDRLMNTTEELRESSEECRRAVGRPGAIQSPSVASPCCRMSAIQASSSAQWARRAGRYSVNTDAVRHLPDRYLPSSIASTAPLFSNHEPKWRTRPPKPRYA